MIDGLTGETSILNLPTDRERAPNRAHRVACEQISLDESRLRQPRAAWPEGGPGVTPAVLAAFEVLIHRLTAQDRFSIGVGVLPGGGPPSVRGPRAGDGLA